MTGNVHAAPAEERIPREPPAVRGVGDSGRPLWSVMIPVYNSLHFLEVAITSVLDAAVPAETMQIEVVDDASTDGDVHELVQRVGKGRVTYHRHAHNRGSLRTFETCLNRARGRLVHMLHADDKVKEGFYAAMLQLMDAHPEAGAAFCRYEYIDDNGAVLKVQGSEMDGSGILSGWLPKIAVCNRIQVPAMVVKREVYEKLGSFYGLTYGEDWVMWVKIARHYPVAYTSQVLAAYRKHGSSITGARIASGAYLDDLQKAMQLIRHDVPVREQKKIQQASRKYYAFYGLKMADTLVKAGGNLQAAAVSIRKSLRLYRNLSIYKKAASLYLKILFRRFRTAK